MAENGADFDLEGYLATRFGDVNKPARVLFPLEMLHKSLPDSLNILDYGTGPVIMTVISAAAKASELVLSDFSLRNLSALRAWLADEPGAFNWTPFFQHVVCDLEGKSVQEAAAREALVRNEVKSVVSANIYSSHIIEEGFEGPYDVVSSSCCLESCCKTRETFKRNRPPQARWPYNTVLDGAKDGNRKRILLHWFPETQHCQCQCNVCR